jgi:hypothetical protein
MFEPVQRRLPGQDRIVRPPRLKLSRNKAENGIVAQLIMIVQVLIAERNAMDALGDERLDAMLNPILPSAIGEAGDWRTLSGTFRPNRVAEVIRT